VINPRASGQWGAMSRATLAIAGDAGATVEGPLDASSPSSPSSDEATRLRSLLDEHYDFIWRALRRPGVDDGGSDDPAPRADDMLDQRRARALLDEALAMLPMELRVVFTLHELEEMSMSEIAELAGIAPGTVASRLRRARQDFETIVARLGRARGGTR